MIRSKIFTFFTVALIGGFVLTTSSDAWAVVQNDEAKKDVLNFISENLVKESGETLKDRKNKANVNADSKIKKYEEKRSEIRDQCQSSYKDAIKKRAEKMAGEAKKTYETWKSTQKNKVEAAKALHKAVTDLSEEELAAFFDHTVSAVADEFRTIFHLGKTAYQGIRALYNVTGLNQLGDDALAWFKDKLTQLIADGVANGYSYEYNAKQIVQYCEENGAKLDQALVEEFYKLAAEAQAADQVSRGLDGFDDFNQAIYSHQFCCSYDAGSKDCKEYCQIDFVVNEEKNTIASVAGVTQGCAPLPFKVYQARSCLFCPLFEIIYNTIQKASTEAYDELGDSLAVLVAIGLSIWLALMVLKHVSAMTQQDGREFLTNLFANSFKVVITFLLLKNSGIIYGWIIGPLLNAGFEFGSSFISSSNGYIQDCVSKQKFATVYAGVLPSEIKINLMCFIEGIQFELGITQAIGDSLMCISVNSAKSDIGAFAKIMPDFAMMLQGALVFAIAFILSIAFSFYLLDATIQLGLFGVLLPFFILCWPFKITNGYFKKGVEIFMNSWFVFVFMGIIVSIVIELIGQSLTGGKGNFGDIQRAINGNDVKALKDLLGIGFSGFLVLIACCVFALKLMMKVEEIADKFSGGLSLGIGSKFGGLAAQGAEKAVMSGVRGAGKVVKGVANAKLWEGKDGKFYSLSDGLRSVKNNVTQKVGHGFTSAARGVGRSIAKPFNLVSNAFHSNSGRRDPSRNP